MLRELEYFPCDIWDAARRGSIAGVQYYWAKDPDSVDRKEGEHWTALHYAADQGHLATAGLLLRLGARVDAEDPDGNTPLFWACINDNLPMLELLLDAGADMDHQCRLSYTPLHWAAMKNCLGTLRLLVRRGADHTIVCRRGQTPLSLACDLDQRACALHLISVLSLAKDIDHMDIHMDTPLTLAARNGHLPVINALLDKGTPMDIAQELELYDIAYYLTLVDHLFNIYYDMEYDRLTLLGPSKLSSSHLS